MASTLVPAGQEPLTDQGDHLHGTLPPSVIDALLSRVVIPAEQSFEAWEDGAYVLAYLRQSGLR